MNSIDGISLTAGEICSIIKAGGKSGLQKLAFHGLSIEFKQSTKEIVVSEQSLSPLGRVAEDPKQMELPSIPFEEDLDHEAINDLMAVEDPERWEKLMLEDDDNAQDGHSQAK